MRRPRKALFILCLFGASPLCGDGLRAQGMDPMREIQELARRIDEELTEIDKLLLESAKPPTDSSMSPRDRLQDSKERSENVEANIDELIQKLNDMKNQSGSPSQEPQDQDQQGQQGQQSQQQQQGQQQQDQQQGRQNRRENEMPDVVDQTGQQQQGQQQQQQQQDGQQPQNQPNQPRGGQPDPVGGDNLPPGQRRDDTTGPGQRGEGQGSWGELQPYTNFLKNRGATPEVPERYRKYWKAYIEAQRKKNGNR
jgi:hypothetical protein